MRADKANASEASCACRQIKRLRGETMRAGQIDVSFPGLTRESIQYFDLKIIGSSPTMTLFILGGLT